MMRSFRFAWYFMTIALSSAQVLNSSTPSSTTLFPSSGATISVTFSFDPSSASSATLFPSSGASINVTFSFDPSTTVPSNSIVPSASATGLAGVTGVSSNVTAFAHLWGWHNCDAGQKSAILQGLEEANDILASKRIFYYTLDDYFNDYAAVEFMGNPRKAYASRQDIKDQFQRAYNYQQHWYHWWDTQVYCVDDNVGYCVDEPGYIAVDNEYNKYGLALGFCSRYFTLGKLRDIYKATSSDPYLKWDLSQYENRARPWITTMFRINSIGKWPRKMVPVKIRYPNEVFAKFVSTCDQAKYLSKGAALLRVPGNDLADVKTLSSPDNWSWFALAQYVTNRLGNYPSLPYVPDDLTPPANVAVTGMNVTDGDELDAEDWGSVYIPW